MVLKNKIIKKIMICLTCCMIIFASTVKPTKAFALVDDVALALIIGGLCAAGGVVLSQDTIKDNVGEFLGDAVDVYSTYMSIPINQAKNALTTLCTGIYDTGTVLATDFNDWLQGWLGTFINSSVLPTFNIDSSNLPTFSTIGNVFVGTHVVNEFLDLSKTSFKNLAYYTLMPSGAVVVASTLEGYGLPIISGKVFNYYDKYTKKIVGYPKSNVYEYSSYHNYGAYLDVSVYDFSLGKIVVTGLHDLAVYIGGTVGYAYYHADTKTWSGGIDGTLELDPGVFNEDLLGDIDIAPPWSDTYNDLTNSMDYTGHYVYGNDMTFDGDNTMDYPGTIVIPKDWDLPWTDTKDYPLVIPTDKPMDLPLDDVTDRYPDYVYPGTPQYTADWTRVFPFCIPFDLFKFLSLFSASPKTPVFTISIGKSSTSIDLKPFDPLALVCRSVFDILFILVLIKITRDKMIKA